MYFWILVALLITVAIVVLGVGLNAVIEFCVRRNRERISKLPPVYAWMQSMADLDTSASHFSYGREMYASDVNLLVHDALAALVWMRREEIARGELPTPLVRFRQHFRELIYMRPHRGLLLCLSEWNHELTKLSIWLLGRSAGEATVTAVKRQRDNPEATVRWHVARALQRTGEWTELQSMAMHDEDPRVRRRAQAFSLTTRGPYRERLRRFAHHCGEQVFEPGRYSSHMPVFMVQPVGPGKPAKSRDFIRRILEHIRELVRSRFKNHAA